MKSRGSDDRGILFVLPPRWPIGAVTAMIDLAERLHASTRSAYELFVLREIPPEQEIAPASLAITYGLPLSDRSNWHWRLKTRIPKVRGLVKRMAATRDRTRLLIRMLKRSRSAKMIVITWENGEALWMPALAAFVCGKPSVVIIQANISHSLEQYPAFPGLAGLRIACHQARKVICVSEDLVSVVCRELRLQDQKVVGITHGVDVDDLAERADGPLPVAQVELAEPFVMGLGRLAPEKGFELLVEAHALALRNGQPHRLLIVGGGDPTPLRQLAERIGVAETVDFAGHLENPFPLLRRAALFCMPSYYEGKSVALLEAAALGVPMVSTDCPVGPRETLGGGKYGRLVPTGSVEAMAEAIRDHFRNPGDLERRAALSALESDRLSVDKTVHKYGELFTEILGG